MKCPRCEHQMVRQRRKDGAFEFYCPNCDNVVMPNGQQEEKSRLIDAVIRAKAGK